MSVVERARIVRVPNEAQLERALLALLEAPGRAGRPRVAAGPGRRHRAGPASRLPHRPSHRRRRRSPPRRRRPPIARARGGRRRGRRAQHVNVGRAARRVAGGIVHNWPLKLAAIVARDAAVRGLRRVAGQQHLPGPGAGDARQPAGRHGHHEPAPRRRADPVHRPGGLSAACARRTSAPRWTSPNVRTDGTPVSVRVDVTPIDPRVTILADPAAVDRRRPRPEDHEAGHRARSIQSRPPEGLQVGETVVTPEDGRGERPVVRRQPRRGGAGQRHDRRQRRRTWTATWRPRRSTTSARSSPASSSSPRWSTSRSPSTRTSRTRPCR